MKAFVSYSNSDREVAEKVIGILRDLNVSVLNSDNRSHEINQTKKENFFELIEESIFLSEILVIIFSRSYIKSKFANQESKAIKIHADVHENKEVIVINLVGERVRADFERYPHIIAHKDMSSALSYFKSLIEKRINDPQEKSLSPSIQDTLNDQIASLRQSHSDGSLTLVCGAGISIGANIPSWDSLLDRLLDAMAQKLTKTTTDEKIDNQGLGQLKSNSSLIIGRYLKNVLDDDFLPELRDALYREASNTSELIDSIVEMSRPKRSTKPLDSIITFNFDDLLEKNLKKNKIEHKGIYTEGFRNKPDEIPIYHVHGFLPSSGRINEKMNIVFSEDAYHDQFTDPFSWSNLIQLSKFSQNTCLFVGLSLSDPNLRRLLDVAYRKDPAKGTRHFMIQKRDSKSSRNRLIESLKEQDAASLGLSIIWTETFNDIPIIIRDIYST